MKIIETGIERLIEIQPRVFADDRGWFVESFKESALVDHLCDVRFDSAGYPSTNFIQDNQSFSTKGTLRGLHFQSGFHAQGKLVKVIKGEVLDVVVDLREGSKTYGEWRSFVLTGARQNMLYVPEGFAHGFYALEDSYFHYKCTNEYNKESESGIIWNDPNLAIDWQLKGEPIVSEKDMELPTLK